MSFLKNFDENVRKYPDKVALEFIDPPLQRVTYVELDEQVNRTAEYLQSLGLQPGDRVRCVECRRRAEAKPARQRLSHEGGRDRLPLMGKARVSAQARHPSYAVRADPCRAERRTRRL